MKAAARCNGCYSAMEAVETESTAAPVPPSRSTRIEEHELSPRQRRLLEWDAELENGERRLQDADRRLREAVAPPPPPRPRLSSSAATSAANSARRGRA